MERKVDHIPHITEKDFHHYAYNEDGQLVFLRREIKTKIPRKDYFCIDCGEVMRPVQGEIKEWHFRHKNENPQCSKESYLHKLGKRVFKERFDNSEEFIVGYHRQLCCPNFNRCKICSINCLNDDYCKINLKEHFDTCVEEKRGDNLKYRADLLMKHSKHPERLIYLEIAYKHICEPEKIASGIKIIEVGVKEDWDIDIPLEEPRQIKIDFSKPDKPYKVEPPSVRFFNFERRVSTDESITIPVDVYIISDESGLLYPELLTANCGIIDIINSKDVPIAMQYMLCVPKGVMEKNELLVFGFVKAIIHGVPIKNCIVCSRYKTGMCRNNNDSNNSYEKAYLCGDYYLNHGRVRYLIDKNGFNYIQCFEWKKDRSVKAF